jgi:hypothetical protein
MQFSTDWVPSLAGNTLPVSKALKELVGDSSQPYPLLYPRWTRREVISIVANSDHPEAIPAVWSSVLSIWRLETLEMRLEKDATMLGPWQAHTSAWLVSTIVARGPRGSD